MDYWLDDDITAGMSFTGILHWRLKKVGVQAIYLLLPLLGRLPEPEVAETMGFRRRVEGPLSGNYLDYDNIDEKLCEINIWLKYLKFGF